MDSAGAPIDLTKLIVNGMSGDDAVVVDTYLGTFNAKTTGTGGGGVVLALGAGAMDRAGFRGTASADNVGARTNAGRAFLDITGDGVSDVMWTSTAGGADTISGSGRLLGATPTPLSATATLAGTAVAGGTVGALTSAFTLAAYGDPGNDQIQGGDGNERLDGGDGDDSFLTASARDGADVFIGGVGADTVSYATPTAALTVTPGLTSAADANDGESGENDDLTSTIENVTGSSGNDTITGSGFGNKLRSGVGNDFLNGGPGGTCTVDVDKLYGDAGDDTFEMSAASDCGDEASGGDGKDLVTYHDRANALTVSRDDSANDGKTSERDNVKTDVEVLVGGQGADTLTGGAVALKMLGCGGDDTTTGSSVDDELSGGPGNDVVNGGSGNDTFLSSGDEPLCFAAVRGVTVSMRGLGADVLNGGLGTEDKLDYTARTAPLTLTLCVDAAAATGIGACGNPRNDGEAGEGDAVLNTEIVEGGQGNDTITGALADEWIDGNGGDDTLNGGGGGGNDHRDGGASINAITGGSGADICDNDNFAVDCDLHVCACTVGTRRDCDRAPENACKVATATDPQNCGACGTPCAPFPNAGSNCTAGACSIGACNSGFTNCDGNADNGCETSLLARDQNCGACGNACCQGQECSNGTCVACVRCGLVNPPTPSAGSAVGGAWATTWTDSAGATSYELRCVAAGGTCTSAAIAESASIAPGTQGGTVLGLTTGTTFSCYLVAYNANTNLCSTNAVSVTPSAATACRSRSTARRGSGTRTRTASASTRARRSSSRRVSARTKATGTRATSASRTRSRSAKFTPVVGCSTWRPRSRATRSSSRRTRTAATPSLPRTSARGSATTPRASTSA